VFFKSSGDVCRNVFPALKPEITLSRISANTPIPVITKCKNDIIEIFGWKQTQA
jgi:hypothetical protein